MKKAGRKSISLTVGYYLLRFYDGEPVREPSSKEFIMKEGKKAEFPCPHCGRQVEVEAKVRTR